jgi:lysyl-tRNA synthetase class II
MITLDELVDLRSRCLAEAQSPNAYRTPELYYALTEVSNSIMLLEVNMRDLAALGDAGDLEEVITGVTPVMDEETMDTFEGEVIQLFNKFEDVHKLTQGVSKRLFELDALATKFNASLTDELRQKYKSILMDGFSQLMAKNYQGVIGAFQNVKDLLGFEGSLTIQERKEATDIVEDVITLTKSLSELDSNTLPTQPT